MVDITKHVRIIGNIPQKPYILRIRSNVLRELVSFLSQTDFLEFCMTCKDFLKLMNDKFVSKKIAIPEILVPICQTLVDKFIDYRSVRLLEESQYPWIHAEWKTVPIKYFHFCIFDSRKFVFLYQEHSFEIREMNDFSNALNSVYSLAYKDKIFYAAGFKNRVMILFRDRLEYLKLNQNTVFFNETSEKNTLNVYKIENEWVKKVRFLNNGRSALLVNRNSIHLLNEKMKLLNVHKFPEESFKLHVPNLYGKNYVTYTANEIKIWKVGVSQEKSLKFDFKIAYIRTSHFDSAPQMVLSNTIGELYIGKKKLKIRCLGKFKVINQFIIFSDYCSRGDFKVFDLVNNCELYSIKNLTMGPLRNLFITPYKMIYELDQKILIENVTNKNKYDLMLSFEEFSQFKCFNNMVIVSGPAGGCYGVFILNMGRYMEMTRYQSQVYPPSS